MAQQVELRKSKTPAKILIDFLQEFSICVLAPAKFPLPKSKLVLQSK